MLKREYGILRPPENDLTLNCLPCYLSCTACCPEMLVPLSDLASVYLPFSYADNLSMLFYGRTYTFTVLSHVISTPAHIDLKTISQTDGDQSSRVPILLPDDPYMRDRDSLALPIEPSPVLPSDDPYLIVRHTHTPVAIDTEFEPKEAPLETEEFQPLAARTAPPSSDHNPISSDYTPVSLLIDEEFEASKPSNTRISSSHSTAPSDSTTPLSPITHSLRKHAPYAFSIFVLSYRSSYETPSPSSSPILPIRKRYQEDKGLSLEEEEEEEDAPKGQQQAVLVVDTVVDEPLGPCYGALRRHESALGEGSVPSKSEARQSSRSASEQQRVEETPAPRPPVLPILVASPATTPTTTIAVDEDEFLEVEAQLELYEGILHGHTQHLDALPPTLFEIYDRDLRELYIRLRAVRDEIFSQCHMLRSLEQEHERATITFDAIWRRVLALESWEGHVNA
nr:hypothetical protein [Tanacetum cinerariifolium]